MTLGYVQREMKALTERVKLLEATKGAFSEEQIGLIARTYAKREFKHLVVWVIAAACLGGGLVLAIKL